ncbi:MAG TPA: class I SAM-dependent methyltransferase [Anaeromyxobacter sp.]|nr:class I SAM-dependent methyltransferase [Anaeromyxobacter sp.]
MGPEGVDQLAPLSALFQEVVLAAQPDRLLLVGCATGNGLEHVDPSVTRRIVGVDVNLQYLGIARQRFFHLGPRLELYNADIAMFRALPGSFDLVHAALVFEYLHAEVLVRRISEWLAERGSCSAVLQLPGGEGAELPSRAMQLVARAMRLVPPEELTGLFAHYGLGLRRQREVPLRGGKRFWHGLFARNTGGGPA